jgi:hypothetical protein
MFSFLSKCKTLVATMLVFALIGSTAATAATPEKEKPITSQQFNQVTDVIFQGTKIGAKNITVQYDRKVSSSGEVTVNLHTDTKFKFEPTVSKEIQNLFQDTTKDDILKGTTDKKYFLNGVDVTNNNIPLTRNNAAVVPLASDTGGIARDCHYYGDYSTYTYACYEGMRTDGSPTGSNITKVGIPFSNAYTNRAQSTIDIFYGDYMNLMAAETAFVVATGIAIVGIETIVAFIVGGVGAIAAAVVVKTDYNIVNSDMQKAYGYISQM